MVGYKPDANKSKKILEKHLPTLEEDVKDIKGKTMSPSQSEDVYGKALDIIERNFKGKQLEKMKKQLDKTMVKMQENYGRSSTNDERPQGRSSDDEEE